MPCEIARAHDGRSGVFFLKISCFCPNTQATHNILVVGDVRWEKELMMDKTSIIAGIYHHEILNDRDTIALILAGLIGFPGFKESMHISCLCRDYLIRIFIETLILKATATKRPLTILRCTLGIIGIWSVLKKSTLFIEFIHLYYI